MDFHIIDVRSRVMVSYKSCMQLRKFFQNQHNLSVLMSVIKDDYTYGEFVFHIEDGIRKIYFGNQLTPFSIFG